MDGIRNLVADVLWAVLFVVMWLSCLMVAIFAGDGMSLWQDTLLLFVSICLMVMFGMQIHRIRKG